MAVRQRGFSIVEAMVAVVIAAIGMLSVAAGQVNNVKYTNNSFDYTMAVLEANSAVERIWQHLCELQKDPSIFETIKPDVQNPHFTISYPEGFVINDFRVVVGWSDERIVNNLANRVEVAVSFPDVSESCI